MLPCCTSCMPDQGKGADIYTALIKNYNIVDLLDLSPGSGQAGSAAVALGVPVTSVVFDDTHLRWLQNVADVTCARLICQKSSHLHQQSLAEALDNFFKEELAQGEV